MNYVFRGLQCSCHLSNDLYLFVFFCETRTAELRCYSGCCHCYCCFGSDWLVILWFGVFVSAQAHHSHPMLRIEHRSLAYARQAFSRRAMFIVLEPLLLFAHKLNRVKEKGQT